MEIKRCAERKDGVKLVLIPKNSDIKKEDLVMIIKMDEKEVEEYGRRQNK